MGLMTGVIAVLSGDTVNCAFQCFNTFQQAPLSDILLPQEYIKQSLVMDFEQLWNFWLVLLSKFKRPSQQSEGLSSWT